MLSAKTCSCLQTHPPPLSAEQSVLNVAISFASTTASQPTTACCAPQARRKTGRGRKLFVVDTHTLRSRPVIPPSTPKLIVAALVW